MKKTKPKKSKEITPKKAVEFLESFRKLNSEIDEATQLISIRIPKNLLKALRLKAQIKDSKYQSLIIAYIRKGLSQKDA